MGTHLPFLLHNRAILLLLIPSPALLLQLPPSTTNTRPRGSLLQFRKSRHRPLLSLFRRPQIPLLRLRNVLRTPNPRLNIISHRELRFREPLLRGLLCPQKRLRIGLRENTLRASEIPPGESEFAFRVGLFRCAGVPGNGLAGIDCAA
jgi:hypothetical protein